ncbi:MAG: DUF2828 family protein [Halanaerobiales bacterium]
MLKALIRDAFNENIELAAKTVFYLGDVREGQGFRDIFRVGIEFMVERYPEAMAHVMTRIPEFTRWDMLYEFDNTRLEDNAYAIMRNVAFEMDKREEPHLIFKWLKSPKTSSKESTRLGRKTARKFYMSEKEYRKFLSRNRKRMNLLERKMSDNEWNDIDYSKIPSLAGLKYRDAFLRHDPEGYEEFLDRVNSGEANMNMDVAYPYEIVTKYKSKNGTDKSLEAAWKSLKDYQDEDAHNILTVVDTSGSMFSHISNQSETTCIDVSISLGIYTAERLKGEFHNNFVTFSQSPSLIQLSDQDSLRDKIDKVERANWGFNTDIDAVFDLILSTAVRNGISSEDMPESILIVSDMQFDMATHSDSTNFHSWAKRFSEKGYELPEIVFWNVAGANSVPVTISDKGVALLSGMSPSILEMVYKGNVVSAYEFMLQVISVPRYEFIGKVFRELYM